MSLLEKQVEEFKRDGCVIVPHFFNDREVRALQLEVERFKREGLGRNVVPESARTSKPLINYQVMPLYDKSQLFRALLFHEGVTSAVEQLIGGTVVRWLDQLFLKPARHGSGTDWHTDNAYFKVPDVTKATGMWIAVHDASKANGTLEVIPGSFRQQEPEHGRSALSDHHIACKPEDESKAVAAEIAAGGVVFFNYGTLHCTRANNTDRDRAGAAFHFNRTDNYPSGTHFDQSNLDTVVLTGPEFTGGLREYGTKVVGTWDAEVERVLRQAAKL